MERNHLVTSVWSREEDPSSRVDGKRIVPSKGKIREIPLDKAKTSEGALLQRKAFYPTQVILQSLRFADEISASFAYLNLATSSQKDIFGQGCELLRVT
jgi:hypothetical protein